MAHVDPICAHSRIGNVMRLLAWREVAPTVKLPIRRLWGEAVPACVVHEGAGLEASSANLALISWLAFLSACCVIFISVVLVYLYYFRFYIVPVMVC